MKIQAEEEKAPCHSTNTIPKDKVVSADDATLFQAILRVIDDGCPCETNYHQWAFDDIDEVAANQRRTMFADAVIATFKRFKHED